MASVGINSVPTPIARGARQDEIGGGLLIDASRGDQWNLRQRVSAP